MNASTSLSSLTSAQQDALSRYFAEEPLPLGTCVYPKGEGYEIVRSRHHRYGPPLGVHCSFTHTLAVDDGAFVDVALDSDGREVKVAYATALSAVPVETPDGWHLRIKWDLPCHETGELHDFETTWRTRRGKTSMPDDPAAAAMVALSVVPRLEGRRFHETHDLRNNTESYNSWVKTRLGTTRRKGRAMRLSVDAQFLDHMCAGTLANAITNWRALQLRRNR